MHLALNTYLYEVAERPFREALGGAARHGFRYVDFAAFRSGDPSGKGPGELAEIARLLKDNGLTSSQLLMSNVRDIASVDDSRRRETLEYMKRCADLQRSLGGREVLVCWGCGVREHEVSFEESWCRSVESIRQFAQWGQDRGILVDLELDPHVYFVVNSTERMARMLEDIDMPNVFPNVDTGHLAIIREGPRVLAKFSRRMLHVHLSESDTFSHTNSILGTGMVDLRGYVEAALAGGIEETCAAHGVPCVAGIEIGSRSGAPIDDPERWIVESLDHLRRALPMLAM